MANLESTISQLANSKTTVIKLQKSRKELSLEDNGKASNIFCSVDVSLNKLPAVSASHANRGGPIIIDANVDNLRRVKSNWTPAVIVVSGLDKLRELKANAAHDRIKIPVWLGTKAFKKLAITASDAIGSNEINSKLQKQLSTTYSVKKTRTYSDVSYMSSPWIVEIYPYDNYCIYSLEGENYKQSFKFDAKTREVTLSGASVKVHQEYVPNIAAAFSPAAARDVGTDMMVTYGAPNSELNNPMLMSNVEEAILAYKTEIDLMQYAPQYLASAAVPNSLANQAREATIAASDAKIKNFSPVDFFNWQNKTMSAKAEDQKRFYKGEMLFASDYAYVGTPKDISTWHCPMHTEKAARASLKVLASTPGIPKQHRVEVRDKLEVAAGGVGSGRHKNFNALLKQHGFATSSNGGFTKDVGQNRERIMIDDNEEWTHSKKEKVGNSFNNKHLGSGTGHLSLKTHLAKFKS